MIPGAAQRGDAERETVHRLEAFSDIVIGFCIAEMGINLLIPRSVAELPHVALGTSGFIFSFVLISIVWWIHHRIFRSFFVLNQLNVTLNFAMLGALVLMVYFQQVSLHFMATDQEPGAAVQAWLLCYGAVYALNAAMLWIGIRARWRTAAEADLRWGLSRAVLASIGTLIFVSYGFVFELRHSARSLFVVPFVVIVLARVVAPRIINGYVARRTVSPI